MEDGFWKQRADIIKRVIWKMGTDQYSVKIKRVGAVGQIFFIEAPRRQTQKLKLKGPIERESREKSL